MTLELRPYQEDGLEAIWNYFKSGNTGNPVLAWPTGTGKSIVPAAFISRVMQHWSNQRFLMITHVKELIEQNYDVLKIVWPNAPVGIYSAGLNQKNPAMPIVFGGIQSMIKTAAIFGHRDIIFIDEAHLVSLEEASMYLKFIAVMKGINPHLKIIGLTATPFRMGQGYITDGGLFTDIVQDLTGMDAFTRLIAEGYLASLIPLRTKTELDISNVGIQKGEFVASQLQSAVDKNEITYKGLQEVCNAGVNRKSWLIFSSGIEHAEHIATMLGTFGIDCAAVHSKQKSEYNDKAIKAFKQNELRSIVCFSKLTTGFNHNDIDMIADFRPTMSIPLHVQKLGRGTRPARDKQNCLVLDFSRNVPRLGPINDPVIPRKKGEREGDAPIKLCEACGAYNHASVRFCCQCGNEFQFKVKIVAKAGTDELLRGELPIVETFNVGRALYLKKQKTGKQPYIRATYFTGAQSFSENVFPEHGGYATKLFHNWWKQRHTIEPPKSTDEALMHISQLRLPKKIRVHLNTKYPAIVGVEF